MAGGTIVIAWVVEETVHDGRPYAHDLGQRPGTRVERVARAAIWLNKGTEADVVKARAYCENPTSRSSTDPESARYAFIYPPTEKDPLGRARRDVLALPSVKGQAS